MPHRHCAMLRRGDQRETGALTCSRIAAFLGPTFRAEPCWAQRSRSRRRHPGFISAGIPPAGICPASLLVTDWQKEFGLPNDIIKGGMCMSGMYDMKPVRLSKRGKYVTFHRRDGRGDELAAPYRSASRSDHRHLRHQRDAGLSAPEPRFRRRRQGGRKAGKIDRGGELYPFRNDGIGRSIRTAPNGRAALAMMKLVVRHNRLMQAMSTLRTGAVLLWPALALAGCSGFGGPKPKQDVVVDPNVYPTNYRQADRRPAHHGSSTNRWNSAPRSSLSRCSSRSSTAGTALRRLSAIPNRTDHRAKAVIFLEASPTQYVDATPQQCGDAAYQPFPELAKSRLSNDPGGARRS